MKPFFLFALLALNAAVFAEEQDTLVFDDMFVIAEAEDAPLQRHVQVVPDDAASAKKYVLFTDQKTGVIAWKVDVKKTGEWYVWGRIYATSMKDNSFYFRLVKNGRTIREIHWHVPYSRKWEWAPAPISEGSPIPIRIEIPKGTDEVHIAWREPGARIDGIFFTQNFVDRPTGR